ILVVLRQAGDHGARRRPDTFVDAIDDLGSIAVTLDARVHVDLEEAAAQVHAADAITVDRDEIRIGRGTVLLRAVQREPVAQTVFPVRNMIATSIATITEKNAVSPITAWGAPSGSRSRSSVAPSASSSRTGAIGTS